MLDVVDKITAELQALEFDAIMVFGTDNLLYLSGARIPFLYSYPDRPTCIVWPKSEEPTIICPAPWVGTFCRLSRIKKIKGYLEGMEDFIDVSKKVVEVNLEQGARIGVDLERIPIALFEELKSKLMEYELIPCDAWLRNSRMIKTSSEVKLLAEVAYRTDHGIFGTAHHVLVTSHRSEMSLSEELRVHCLERGLDVVGYQSVSVAASGEHARKFWPLAPNYGVGYEKPLRPDEYVRMEMKTSLDGYWSDAARLMTMGKPKPGQWTVYESLVALRVVMVRYLRPGVRCSVVYDAVKEEVERRGINLIGGLAIGHGVGVTDREAPYISASSDTVLEPGMVLVLDPIIEGPDGELLWSKDTVVITPEGCKLIGWYKDWREPYIANHTL